MPLVGGIGKGFLQQVVGVHLSFVSQVSGADVPLHNLCSLCILM